jgi:hypothetical protein
VNCAALHRGTALSADELPNVAVECVLRERVEQREVDLQGGLLSFFHDSEPY